MLWCSKKKNLFYFFFIIIYSIEIINASLSKEYLDLHNEMRLKTRPKPINLPLLEWDEKLAQYAQRLADRCQFDHDPAQRYGESIAQQASIQRRKAVTGWYNEIEFYDLVENSCESGQECGHYLQIVWSATKKLGCGEKACGGVAFIFCEYYPGRNSGNRPYSTLAKRVSGRGNESEYLKAQNDLRTKLNTSKEMRRFVWNNDLAKNAKKMAYQCDVGPTPKSKYGEVIFRTETKCANPKNISIKADPKCFNRTQVVQEIYNQKSYYNFCKNRCFKRDNSCNDYTQVIWPHSERVGCAEANCTNFIIVVCKYSPGRTIGVRPYEQEMSSFATNIYPASLFFILLIVIHFL